ncbi:hypothetical protein [Streptomyces longwoodensis]|uniref:hypothetical protein n=1 Tax=Streptomyces longwoodensis TaxID=68231 RepID=UPI0037027D0D
MAATFTLKYNGSTVHVEGAKIRTVARELDYSLSACPVLSRSVRFCEKGSNAESAAEVIKEAKALAVALGKKVCRKCLQALEAQAEVEAAEAAAQAEAEAEAAAQAAAAPVVKELTVARPAARTTRAALGAASATGWELLYDKPKAGAEVGRRFLGEKAQYALICKAHGHVHRLERLADEGQVRKAGGWCSSCSA